MKNKTFIVKALLASAVVLPLAVWAADFRSGERASLGNTEISSGDLYMAGGNVSVLGKAEGDVFAGGGSVVVSGPVGGDLFAGGGTVTVLGDVADDLRAGGGNVMIMGHVGGDAILGGGQINIGGAGIEGDLVVGAGAIEINAPVKGDILAGGGEIYINSVISGNVKMKADKVTLGPQARIVGGFAYTASEKMKMEAGSVIAGEVKFTERAVRTEKFAQGISGFKKIFSLLSFGMLLVGAYVLAFGLKKFSSEVVREVVARPVYRMGYGLIALVVLPVVSILLLITLIGIPLGVLGFITLIGLLIVSCWAGAIITGAVAYKLLFKGADYEINWKTVLFGALIYSAVGLIPFVGSMAKFLLMLVSLGSILQIKIGILKNWR